MHKNYKQALLLLKDIKAVIEDRSFLSDEEERILDEINTIFTDEQENNGDFIYGYMEREFEKMILDNPYIKSQDFDKFFTNLDTDTRYGYFISFLQS